MKAHKDMDVWKQAIDLSKYVYQLTHTYPEDEMFGYSVIDEEETVSITSNIAEGAARRGNREFTYFL